MYFEVPIVMMSFFDSVAYTYYQTIKYAFHVSTSIFELLKDHKIGESQMNYLKSSKHVVSLIH